MRIEVRAADEAAAAVSSLLASVWTPERMAASDWRDVVTAKAHRRVLIWDGEDGLICHVALFLRRAIWNDQAVLVGGVGGVCTQPDLQGRGLARAAMARAAAYLGGDAAADFGLLFCAPRRYRFYEQCGWHRFGGQIFVEQPGGRIDFRIGTPFVRDLKVAPRSGHIDLLGPPW